MGDELMIVLSGFGLIGVGLYLMFGKIGGDKPGQRMVEATIVDHVLEQGSRNSDHPTHASTVSTFPLYEYTVDGKTYRTRGTVAITVFSKEKYRVGATESIRINPSKPNRIHTSAERNSLAVFGAFFVVFGLVALFCSW